MAETGTAEIIPFPTGRMEQVGRERLDRSLVRLQAALAEQAGAVADWRTQLDRLRVGVDALGRRFGDYDAQLGAAKQGVDAVNAEVRRLESWADGVLRR
jgi:hypothetical protein